MTAHTVILKRHPEDTSIPATLWSASCAGCSWSFQFGDRRTVKAQADQHATPQPKRPRLAVPVKLADRVWTYRDEHGRLIIQHGHEPLVAPGQWESRYAAACNWCDWTCGPSLTKAGVTEQARWHRDHHRREAKP